MYKKNYDAENHYCSHECSSEMFNHSLWSAIQLGFYPANKETEAKELGKFSIVVKEVTNEYRKVD